MLLLPLLLGTEEEEEAILKCWLSADADDDEDVRNRKALVVVLKWLSANMKRHKAVAVRRVEAAKRLGRRGSPPQRCGMECRSSWLGLLKGTRCSSFLSPLSASVECVCVVGERGGVVGWTCLASSS